MVTALSLVLALPPLLLTQSSAPARPAEPGAARAKIVYQKSQEVQRVYVTVPAAAQGWVRTGINPQSLAGREVAIAWTANIHFAAKRESLSSFKQRLGNIALRQVHDPNKKPTTDPAEVARPRDCDLFDAGAEAQLPVDNPVCFAQLPGELELRFYGAKPDDRGHYRVFFASEAYTKADTIMNDGVADKIELFPEGRKLTAPPPLPAPR